MKKLSKCVVLTLALAALLALCGARAETFYSMQVAFCEEYVNLRPEPSASSGSLGQVYVGEVVMAAPYNDEFSYCCYNGRFGYIKNAYLSADIQVWSEGTFRVANCNEYISLRAMPTTSADVRARIPLGATLDAIFYHDGGYTPGSFVYVKYNGQCGFVLWDYLEYVWVEGWQ